MDQTIRLEVARHEDFHAREVIPDCGHEIQSALGLIGSSTDCFSETRIDCANAYALRYFGSWGKPAIRKASLHVEPVSQIKKRLREALETAIDKATPAEAEPVLAE